MIITNNVSQCVINGVLAFNPRQSVLSLLLCRWLTDLGEGSKKILFFFYFRSKGGRGGLGQSKKSLSENTQIFLTKGGGSHPIQKGFIRKTEIFWHNLPKKGGFIKKTGIFLTISAKRGVGLGQSKKSLSEKTGIFLTISPKRGGVSAKSKNPYQKKLRWSKKGEGGRSQFFD